MHRPIAIFQKIEANNSLEKPNII